MPKKILLIEDDSDLAGLVALRLQSQGFEAVVAPDGLSGIQQAKALSPDLILLDLMMPGMDGWEAARKLKEDPATAKIPVVVFTAAASPDLARKVREVEAADFVVKPFEPKELIAKIQKILGRPGKKRILFVDDEKELCETIRAHLETHQFQVVTALSGPEALKQAQENSPDLILLDLKMPGMDGFEVLKSLKADAETASLPTVVLTALGDEENAKRAVQLGAKGFLVKPFDSDSLVFTIQEFLK